MASKTNKIQQTKKALLLALEQSLGVVTQACRQVGINRTTFYKYVNEDTEFAAAVKDMSEIAVDFVESKLFKQIRESNTAATIFYLKTKAKHRGYVERIESTGKDGGPIDHRRTTPDISLLTDEELDQYESLLDRARRRAGEGKA